jgi:carboxypeptidase PM20D1
MRREIVPGGQTLLFTWAGSDPSLQPVMLMAHQDVVPVGAGTEDKWDAPPFSGAIQNGYIYGRGAIDDKGSLVAIMEAVEALIHSDFKPARTVHLMFGHDEEVSGSGAEAAVALLKSRGVRPAMVLDEGYVVVEQSPLTGKTMGFIGVAEKGYMTLKITALATGGHSSTPPRDSAAVRLSKVIVALEQTQMPSHANVSPASDLFKAAGPDMPFAQRLVMANQWLFGGVVNKRLSQDPVANAMIRTTMAPTMLSGSPKENVLPQRAGVTVNFRLHPNDTIEDVMTHIKTVTRHIPGIEIGEPEWANEASPVSPTDNQAYAVLASVADKLGDGAPVAPAVVLGATDARYASAISDSVYRFAPSILSPSDLTGFHGTNERISVENMRRMAEGYAVIILAMDQTKDQAK